MANYSKDTPIAATAVTLKGVADLLNTTANSDGVTTAKYDVGSVCTSGKVNMWAKYKPFSIFENDVVSGTNGNIAFDNVDDELRQQRNYGLKTTGVQFPMWYWTWNKPRLGKEDPGRLGDFRGYLHNAKAPYSIRVKNIIDTAEIEVDKNPIVNVYSVKGFQLLTNAVDKTEFKLYANSVAAYEYSTNFLSRYNNIILCINTNGIGYTNPSYKYWNVVSNSLSIVLPLNPLNTPYDYDAVMLASTTKLTYDGDNGTTNAPEQTGVYPLLCKNNKFTLRLNRVTVWDNSTIIWSSLQIKIASRDLNKSIATGQNGTNETWNIYRITEMNASCNITFDSKYARSFYMFLASTIGFGGSTSTSGTNNPFRIVKASVANANSGVEYCLKNNMWSGGLGYDSSNSQYYDKQTSGTSCSFTKYFDLSDNIYICVKTGVISTINSYINTKLHGYSRNSKTDSNYDCGEGSSTTKQIDYSKLTSATLNSYVTL